MRVLGLDHVNIAGPIELLERVRAFYIDVLGLVDGPRPQFRRRGFWLYAGNLPIVHLSEKSTEATGASALDHFSFTCEGLDDMIARLGARGIAFELDPAREGKRAQIFVTDPAGVSVELNFR
jgi:catechol 2,3-dioxygenase-like lactoylglutathione lyase family enzyme